LQGRAVEGGSREAAIIVSIWNQAPALMPLALDIGLAGLALGIERIEFEIEIVLGRFAGVDRAALGLGNDGLPREYQGERHTVTVVAKGYVWREAIYASLSIIARAITGTAWNGPRFFGLRIDKGAAVSPDAAGAPLGPLNRRHLARNSGIRPQQAAADIPEG
jgi:Protein of unknown function (DUF2924)